MKNDPHLVSVKRGGKFTGDYKCSMCDTVFRPHPTDQGVMNTEFISHIALAHPKSKPRREDVNRAAARVVREATKD